MTTSKDFCYWLNGFFNASSEAKIKSDQLNLIKNKLNDVFIHEIDPSYGDEDHQHELNLIHNETNDSNPIYRC